MDGPEPKRLRLSKVQLDEMTKDDLINHWIKQEQYVDVLETRASDGQKDNSELVSLRESEEKMKQQQSEATRRENVLVMRLTTKEQEMQEYANQIQELKQAQVPGMSQLRSTLLDPAVNLMFERMKKELELMKAKLEETQNDLSAWKFTPDSNTGKRLMAKCRLLHQENEELGKIISSGRVAKLEGDLALQRNFSEEMKKSQAEVDEFIMELDEDVEGMQSTIYYLQQQLRDSKEMIAKLQQEMGQLKPPLDSDGKLTESNAASPVVDLNEYSGKNSLSDAGNTMDVSDESNGLELRTPDSLTNEFLPQNETPEATVTSPWTNGEPGETALYPRQRTNTDAIDVEASVVNRNNFSSVPSSEDCKAEERRTLSPRTSYLSPPPPPEPDSLTPSNSRSPTPQPPPKSPERSTTPSSRSYTPPPKIDPPKDENGLSGNETTQGANSDAIEGVLSPHTPAGTPPPPIHPADDFEKDNAESVVPRIKHNNGKEKDYDHKVEVESKRTSIPNGVLDLTVAGGGDSGEEKEGLVT